MKIKNVLVYPGNSDLGSEIIDSLQYNKDIKLFSASKNQLILDFPFQENHFIIPDLFEMDNLNDLNKIIELNRIDFVYPAKDEYYIELVKNENKIPAKIISSPLNTWLITNSSTKLVRIFNNEIPVVDINEKGDSGEIYKVSCISDRERGLLFCDGMKNLEKLHRYSTKSRFQYQKIFNDFAQKILNKIDIFGGWTFQINKINKETFKLIDITPRIDLNTTVIYRLLGVNLPLLSVYECERDNFQILRNKYDIKINRNQINQYKILIHYKKIYIDLDDTIILKNKLNIKMYDFLNQCVNANKKIILITKHQYDAVKTLEKFKISPHIFNKILHLGENDEKSKYIFGTDSIFIDDSYNERKRVKEVNKIPVFDPSMIEGLM